MMEVWLFDKRMMMDKLLYLEQILNTNLWKLEDGGGMYFDLSYLWKFLGSMLPLFHKKPT